MLGITWYRQGGKDRPAGLILLGLVTAKLLAEACGVTPAVVSFASTHIRPEPLAHLLGALTALGFALSPCRGTHPTPAAPA